MTAFLMVAGIVVVCMVAAGLWFMERAGVEPGARSTGKAPDPTEETEVENSHAHRADLRSGILVKRPTAAVRGPKVEDT